MREGEVVDGWRVSLGGRLLWADTFRIGDHLFDQLGRRAILAKSRAIATLIIFGPDPEGRLERVRDCLKSLPCRAGATALAGLLLLRFAAPEAVELRRALLTFLDAFGPAASFHVPKMWSC
jgi:urease accessory protein